MIDKVAVLLVQKWGNSLAVRIPSKIARSAHFQPGTCVELVVKNGVVIVKPTGTRKLTLKDRLEMFDRSKHRGEIMAAESIGAEKF